MRCPGSHLSEMSPTSDAGSTTSISAFTAVWEGARKGFDSRTAIGASCGALNSSGTAGGADESDNRLLASSDVRGVESFCGRIDPLDSPGPTRHLLMKPLV